MRVETKGMMRRKAHQGALLQVRPLDGEATDVQEQQGKRNTVKGGIEVWKGVGKGMVWVVGMRHKSQGPSLVLLHLLVREVGVLLAHLQLSLQEELLPLLQTLHQGGLPVIRQDVHPLLLPEGELQVAGMATVEGEWISEVLVHPVLGTLPWALRWRLARGLRKGETILTQNGHLGVALFATDGMQ
jgi:hypothetical protein